MDSTAITAPAGAPLSRRDFTVIYDAYADALLHYCRCRTASEMDAEEIAHDCFVGLWQARDAIRDSRAAKSYLYTAARHAIVDYYRRRAASIVTELHCELNDAMLTDSGLSTPVEAEEFRREVMAAIAALPSTQREAINLVRIQGLDICETADKLGLSQQTIKNALTSGCHTLRDVLKKYLPLLMVLLSQNYVSISEDTVFFN